MGTRHYNVGISSHRLQNAAFVVATEEYAPSADAIMQFNYISSPQPLVESSILTAAINYYRKVFVDENGDSYETRRMAKAAQLFNPV